LIGLGWRGGEASANVPKHRRKNVEVARIYAEVFHLFSRIESCTTHNFSGCNFVTPYINDCSARDGYSLGKAALVPFVLIWRHFPVSPLSDLATAVSAGVWTGDRGCSVP
jgi:hypothetical protein